MYEWTCPECGFFASTPAAHRAHVCDPAAKPSVHVAERLLSRVLGNPLLTMSDRQAIKLALRVLEAVAS